MPKPNRRPHLMFITNDVEGGGAGQVDRQQNTLPSGQQPDANQHQSTQQNDSGQHVRESGEHGYPLNTPLTEMTVEQREAYWKHRSRKHEDAWKSVSERNLTPEQILENQKELDTLRQAQMDDHEKAIAAAKKEAAADAAREYAPRLARAAVESALARAGVPAEQIDGEVRWADLSKFLTQKGEVDADKVTEFASARAERFISENAADEQKQRFPDMGAGKRGTTQVSAKARADQIARARGYVRD